MIVSLVDEDPPYFLGPYLGSFVINPTLFICFIEFVITILWSVEKKKDREWVVISILKLLSFLLIVFSNKRKSHRWIPWWVPLIFQTWVETNNQANIHFYVDFMRYFVGREGDLKVPHIKLLNELTQHIPIIIDQLLIKIS